ncbi:MAG: regulatory iron-sulfur-containing complex subunit RicT [Oscillospiraceae bacterium]|nr:regulatory iron-sulfur-containing complex subunit RicT [Oscillospiraceae bacterium]
MTEIIGVRFKEGGKQYFFDPGELKVTPGQNVIVETGKGLEFGTCVRANGFVEDDAVVQPLRPVVRLATRQDEKQVADNRRREKETMRICRQLVERHGLDMNLVSVEFSFDGSKIIFFFTSEGRVDFRALVKDLAGIFRARIELRQIGVRDEARMLGGLGICGKPFCCHQFLEEFQPVSIKMAKTQNLSLNPAKISGTCGRLMCCLKYEQDAYEDAIKRCPKQDSFVECPDGVGTITSVNLLKEQVKVKIEDSTELPKNYRTAEIRVVRSGKGKRPEDYVAPPQSELEKLRCADQPEQGRKLGEMDDLSLRLAQYLGEEKSEEPAPQQEGKKPPRRRHRGGQGRNRAEEAAPQQPKAESKPQKAGEQEKKERRAKAEQKQPKSPEAKPAEKPAEGGQGEKKSRPRHRPHRRRPKSGGEQKPQQ